MKLWQTAKTLLRIRGAYRDTFQSEPGREVLKDLARTCRVTQSNFDADPRVHAYNEGKRAIWLRVQNMLNMSEEQIYKALEEDTE